MLNVTSLRYENAFEDASQETNVLFDLASQITKNSTNMTTVVTTAVLFNVTEFEAIVSNVRDHQMQSIKEL